MEIQVKLQALPSCNWLQNQEVEVAKQLRETSFAKEKILQQRAKCHWLKYGDANTIFSCHLESQKNSK